MNSMRDLNPPGHGESWARHLKKLSQDRENRHVLNAEAMADERPKQAKTRQLKQRARQGLAG